MTAEQVIRFKKIRSVLLVILLLNWGVALAKIFYGLITNFTSMAADGFHSLSDGASNIIGLIGITIACRPADEDHPYGHRKYETLFSLGIAALLFILCFNLFAEAIKRFRYPVTPEVNIISLIVMVITMFVNIAVMKYEHREGERLNSEILVSDAMHTRADIFVSLSVIATMGVIKLGYPVLDPVVTMIIALLIAHAGYDIVKHSSNILCDGVIIDDKKIFDIAMSVKEVKSCHKIRTRGTADDIHVDLHVQVSPSMHIDKAHDVCYKIESAIKAGIEGVTDVVVHIEPDRK